MGVGDISFGAVASLKSIDEWIATINSNMAGAGRVGYKATRVKFAGGTTSTSKPTSSPTLGVHVAEQSLGIVQTTIDFTQGSVVASTDSTHFAIQQTGASVPFFVLSDSPDPTPGTDRFYYTRDGEFHWSSDSPPLLVNSEGLYVMSTDLDAISLFDDGDATPSETNVGGGALNDEDTTNGIIDLNRLRIVSYNNPQIQLQFSRFGSTIFEEPGTQSATPPNIGSNGGTLLTPDALGNFANGRVVPNSLEASNANLTQSVPELSLAQKMYSAITKVIQVSLTNIDSALGLIR